MSLAAGARRIVKSEAAISGRRVIYLTDEGRGLRMGVAPQAGGEIASFQYRWKDQWWELLYRACQFEPPEQGWRGRAPWLFPAVGRNFTPDQLDRIRATGVEERVGAYAFRDRVYSMPCHGFVMDREWQVVDPLIRVARPAETEDRTIACMTRSDNSTRACYPFSFLLSITYSLLESGYSARVAVVADSDNSEEMLFSIGNHITVVAPFTSSGDAGACQVRTPARFIKEISPQSLFTGTSTPVDYRNGVALRDDPSLANMVLGGFKPDECYVEFIDPASFGLRISQREIPGERSASKTSPEHLYFVFYSNPERTFFCPEPWYGGPNSLNDQSGVVLLKPGEQFQWEMSVTVL